MPGGGERPQFPNMPAGDIPYRWQWRVVELLGPSLLLLVTVGCNRRNTCLFFFMHANVRAAIRTDFRPGQTWFSFSSWLAGAGLDISACFIHYSTGTWTGWEACLCVFKWLCLLPPDTMCHALHGDTFSRLWPCSVVPKLLFGGISIVRLTNSQWLSGRETCEGVHVCGWMCLSASDPSLLVSSCVSKYVMCVS